MTDDMKAALDAAEQARVAFGEAESRARAAIEARAAAEQAYRAAREAAGAADRAMRAAFEARSVTGAAIVEIAAPEQLPPLRSDQLESVSVARVRRKRFERRGKGAAVVTVTWRAERDADLGVRLVLFDQTETAYRGGSHDAERALATLRYLEERAEGGER